MNVGGKGSHGTDMARPRSFDEEAVLERAIELFREEGFEGASVLELTERLGICRQSLYNTFGDKRGLFLAALRRYGEREIDSRLAHLSVPGSPLANVRTIVRGMADLATRCPGNGCLTVTALVDVPDDEETRAVVEEQVDRLERGFHAALNAARAAGELGADVNTARLARSLTTMFFGLGVLSRLPGSGPRIADAVGAALETLEAAEA